MLQPLSMPEEFVFEPNLPQNVDTSDDDHGDVLLPGPAPPAPMAPTMAEDTATTQIAPTASLGPVETTDLAGQKQNRISSTDSVDSAINESGSSQTVNDAEDDEDEITYEPTKTPSRTLRSAKTMSSASRPKSRANPGSSKSRPRPEPSFRENPQSQQPEPKSDPESDTEPPELSKWSFEIVINPLSSQAAQEFKPIPPGDEIYRVLSKIPTGIPGETWLAVEFEDGRIDQVGQRKRALTTHVSCPRSVRTEKARAHSPSQKAVYCPAEIPWLHRTLDVPSCFCFVFFSLPVPNPTSSIS